MVGAFAVFAITPGASAQAPDASAQTPGAAPPASSASRPPELDPSAYDARYADAIANAQRVMRAAPLRAEEQVVLDGILEEPVWQRAQPATDFIQQDPVQGGQPTERTEVRIAFSKTALYMGVLCYDSEPDKMLGNTMKRDEFLQGDDRFQWTMDTFLDRQTGYFFEMNPAGLMADSYMGTSGDNRNWDGIWNARVRRSEIGWTIEIQIPFTTLSFDANAPAWGINFQRSIRRKFEENLWTGHLRNQGLRRMTNAGLLIGLKEVSQGVGLDVRPYTAASVSDSPGRDVPVGFGGTGAVGLDMLYNITPSLRGNLTINTDFAETEVDQRLVNLTRFPLFFPERRTFFLDGATFFDFYRGAGGGGGNGGGGSGPSPTRPFFSRNVGLSDGQPQPIDIGAKVTGQVGRQDIGALLIRTRETDTLQGEDFAVVRAKRRFLAQSYVAGIYTMRHMRGGSVDDRQTAGVDLRLQTNSFRGRQNLEFDAFYLRATPTEKLGDSAAYGARVGFPNFPWDASFSWEVVEPNHAPAIGFVPRTGFKNYNPRVGWNQNLQRHPWLRSFGTSWDANLIVDMNNRWLTREINWSIFRFQTNSQEGMFFQLSPEYQRLEEDFEISSGIVLPAGSDYSFTRFRVGGFTANRRVVSLRSNLEVGNFYSGTRREITANLNIRARRGVRLQVEAEWNDVKLLEGAFDTRVYRMISDTQFSPFVFVVNNVQYDTVSKILGWQSRLRWTLVPGNDLFFIYTHNWLDFDTLDGVRTAGLGTLDRRAAVKFVYTKRF